MEILNHAQRDALQRSTLPRAVHRRWSSAISLPQRSMVRTTLLLTVALASLGVALQAPAANSQQERMTACNAEAKSQTLSGTKRQDFMKHCLAGEETSSAQGLNSQQQKMKTCSAEAKSKGLKGADHKQFMSSCLKSSS
jgi:psiF repeat